ncbi:hypothetical protein BGY98DRAFT_1049942 [Russula aff. rugulosa BPL654]|nr:hypothetical protein BGY98DRAFT_1049942 [Russula aff. rugulosa BPL654]
MIKWRGYVTRIPSPRILQALPVIMLVLVCQALQVSKAPGSHAPPPPPPPHSTRQRRYFQLPTHRSGQMYFTWRHETRTLFVVRSKRVTVQVSKAPAAATTASRHLVPTRQRHDFRLDTIDTKPAFFAVRSKGLTAHNLKSRKDTSYSVVYLQKRREISVSGPSRDVRVETLGDREERRLRGRCMLCANILPFSGNQCYFFYAHYLRLHDH